MPLDQPSILRTLMQWRTRLAAAAWLVTRDAHAAEDIFQTVAVRAIAGDAAFDAEAALVSWAFVCTRHAAIDWSRRRRREAVGIDAAVLERVEAEWIGVGADDVRLAALRACLEAVPEASRRLLRLRYADGRGCAEVAERLGAGLDAVYKRLSRLHAALRRCVEGKLAAAGGADR